MFLVLFFYYLPEADQNQNTKACEISQYSLGWYEKIVSPCEENDIQVAVVSIPTTTSGKNVDPFAAYAQFYEEKGIPYLKLCHTAVNY